MKLLLEQQEEILQNYKSTADATEADLVAAINQHLAAVVKKNDLLPLVSGAKRKYCKKDTCSSTTIDFKTIDGCFCRHCGYVFPF